MLTSTSWRGTLLRCIALNRYIAIVQSTALAHCTATFAAYVKPDVAVAAIEEVVDAAAVAAVSASVAKSVAAVLVPTRSPLVPVNPPTCANSPTRVP